MAKEPVKTKKPIIKETKVASKQNVKETTTKAKAKKDHVTEITKKVETQVSKKELAQKAKKARQDIAIGDVEEKGLLKALALRNESSRNKEHYDEYLHMFKKVQTAIRMFEKELRFSKSTRNVYALIALYSQQREIIADIRAITDYTENVNRIMSSLIQPLFSNITQSNLDIFYHIRKLVIEVSKDDQTQYALKRLEDLMREQGRYLQDKYENASEKLTQIISEGR